MNGSLVVPAYNEAGRIEDCVRSIAAWARTRPGGRGWEILVVDDGSTDDTAERARRVAAEEKLDLRLISYAPNRGKGAAIREGVLASTGDPVLVSDADLSTPLSEFAKLDELLATHPVAIGSRAIDEALVRRRQPLHRVLLGKLGNGMIQLFAVPGIRDTQCGFKLFRRDAARVALLGRAHRPVRLGRRDPLPRAPPGVRDRGGARPLVQLSRLQGARRPGRRPDALRRPTDPLDPPRLTGPPRSAPRPPPRRAERGPPSSCGRRSSR